MDYPFQINSELNISNTVIIDNTGIGIKITPTTELDVNGSIWVSSNIEALIVVNNSIGSNNESLKVSNTGYYWAEFVDYNIPGSNTNILYNNSSSMAATPAMTFDESTNNVNVSNSLFIINKLITNELSTENVSITNSIFEVNSNINALSFKINDSFIANSNYVTANTLTPNTLSISVPLYANSGGTGANNITLAKTNLNIANLTHQHSANSITSDTFDTALLGSGTANSSTFLCGNSYWLDTGSIQSISNINLIANTVYGASYVGDIRMSLVSPTLTITVYYEGVYSGGSNTSPYGDGGDSGGGGGDSGGE